MKTSPTAITHLERVKMDRLAYSNGSSSISSNSSPVFDQFKRSTSLNTQENQKPSKLDRHRTKQEERSLAHIQLLISGLKGE